MVVRPSIMGIEPIVHGGHLRLSGYKVIHIPLIWRIRYWDDDPLLGWFWCQPCPSCQPIHCSLDIRGGQRSNDSGVGKWIRKSIRTCNACINVIYIYILVNYINIYIYIHTYIYRFDYMFIGAQAPFFAAMPLWLGSKPSKPQVWLMWKCSPESCLRKPCHSLEISWTSGMLRWRMGSARLQGNRYIILGKLDGFHFFHGF
jgi:hypothetical protein